MSTRLLRSCFVLVTFFLGLISTSAQQPFKAIVLINGAPFLVDLAYDGSIAHKFQNVPNYFTQSTTDKEIISQLANQGLIEDDDFSVFQRPTASTTLTSKPDYVDGVTIFRDRQFISFSLQRAVLNREAVTQVRAIADAYQEKRFEKVMINAYHIDTPESRILARNRANAIADLMETFGVSPGSINVNLPVTLRENNLSFVNISFN